MAHIYFVFLVLRLVLRLAKFCPSKRLVCENSPNLSPTIRSSNNLVNGQTPLYTWTRKPNILFEIVEFRNLDKIIFCFKIGRVINFNGIYGNFQLDLLIYFVFLYWAFFTNWCFLINEGVPFVNQPRGYMAQQAAIYVLHLHHADDHTGS